MKSKVPIPGFASSVKKQETKTQSITTLLSKTVKWETTPAAAAKNIEVVNNDKLDLRALNDKVRASVAANEPKKLAAYDRMVKATLDSFSLLVPHRAVRIFGQEKTESQDVIEMRGQVINNFLDIAKGFIELTVVEDAKAPSAPPCPDCNSPLENDIWCSQCLHYVNNARTEQTETTCSNRNMTDRLSHFKNIVEVFQGIENFTIEDADLDTIRKYAVKHEIAIPTMSKDTLLHILEETNLSSKLDEHINKLHSTLTGIPCHNISHIEQRIYSRHEAFISMFLHIRPDERQHSPKPWYLFYQYLVMEEYEVNSREFPMLKMKETLSWHNEMMKKTVDALIASGSPFKWVATEVTW